MGKTETGLDSIKCPGCGEVIPISETIYHQVAKRAERELKAKSLRQERALAEREKQLHAREQDFDHRVQDQVKAAAAELQAKAEQQARQSVSLELEDLKRQSADKDEKLRAAEQAELQLRLSIRSHRARAKRHERCRPDSPSAQQKRPLLRHYCVGIETHQSLERRLAAEAQGRLAPGEG
jgi:hypothetical protein